LLFCKLLFFDLFMIWDDLNLADVALGDVNSGWRGLRDLDIKDD